MSQYKTLSPKDKKQARSLLTQLIDIVQEDISGSSTTKAYQVFVTGGIGPGVTSSLFQTVYDQDFTLQTANPVLDMTIGLFHSDNGTTRRENLVTLGTGYQLSNTTEQVLFDASTTMMMREKINIYRQYAQLLLDPSDKKFTVNGVDTETIYIMNFNRARMREKIDPGNFELTLSHMTGSGNNMPNAMHTGSNVKISGSGKFIQITDDSSINDPSAGEAGLVYNLISGSIDGGINIHQPSSPVYYGLFYPQHGVAILNADTLDKDLRDGGINMNTVTGSLVQGDNAVKLFTSLSSSKGLMPSTKTGGVQARSSEQVKSTYYFVRVKNGEYNYSNNPTFTSGSMGELAFTSFVADPQAYITTVGMYNVKKELLAVAKLSQPLLKNFTREALIKVKLDF